jgi:hypothetical protein
MTRTVEQSREMTGKPAPAPAPEVTPQTALQEWNAEVLDSQPGLREAFLAMLELVPEPDGDATARIVASILGSQTVEDLDAPWTSEGMREYADVALRIKRIVKMPSDYQGGLGVYLVCYVDQPGIGEEFILSTGSVSIVAQLVRAHSLGALPLTIVPKIAAKPTRQGFYPMHLELVRAVRRQRAVVIDQAPGEA